jgi:hypothetical protein
MVSRFWSNAGPKLPPSGPFFAQSKLYRATNKTEKKEGFWEVAKSATAQSRSHGRPRKYIPSHHTDKMIKAAYIHFRRHGDRSILHSTAMRLGWPSHAVSRRARELGVVPVALQRPWSRTELGILKKGILSGAETIRRQLREEGFHRSIGSILAEKTRALVPLAVDHSARQVAFSLGVDPHKVLLWIRRGLLAARRKNSSRWLISAEAIRTFVFAHPQHFDLAKADKLWLLKLLEGKYKKRRTEPS